MVARMTRAEWHGGSGQRDTTAWRRTDDVDKAQWRVGHGDMVVHRCWSYKLDVWRMTFQQVPCSRLFIGTVNTDGPKVCTRQ